MDRRSTQTKKAEALANVFHKSHTLTLDSGNKFTNNKVAISIKRLNESKIVTSEVATLLTKPNEILAILKYLKTRKSPGDDHATNLILKKLPKRAVVLLTRIFNACLKFCYFPSIWKIAKVIAVPKPNKCPMNATSCRPISLISSVSKLFERILLKRIC